MWNSACFLRLRTKNGFKIIRIYCAKRHYSVFFFFGNDDLTVKEEGFGGI